jgi:hypothetical protein
MSVRSSHKWWIKVAGSSQRPFTRDDWEPLSERSLFPRRPSIRGGDRLVVYAAGSGAVYGEGRIFAVQEVVSDVPEPSGHERWKWQLHVRELVSVPRLSHAPTLWQIGVAARSLSQHSHIALTPEQGRTAEELIRRYAAEFVGS